MHLLIGCCSLKAGCSPTHQAPCPLPGLLKLMTLFTRQQVNILLFQVWLTRSAPFLLQTAPHLQFVSSSKGIQYTFSRVSPELLQWFGHGMQSLQTSIKYICLSLKAQPWLSLPLSHWHTYQWHVSPTTFSLLGVLVPTMAHLHICVLN